MTHYFRSFITSRRLPVETSFKFIYYYNDRFKASRELIENFSDLLLAIYFDEQVEYFYTIDHYLNLNLNNLTKKYF